VAAVRCPAAGTVRQVGVTHRAAVQCSVGPLTRGCSAMNGHRLSGKAWRSSVVLLGLLLPVFASLGTSASVPLYTAAFDSDLPLWTLEGAWHMQTKPVFRCCANPAGQRRPNRSFGFTEAAAPGPTSYCLTEGSRKLMTDVPSRVLKTGMRGE
jgi:hypothetical protein